MLLLLFLFVFVIISLRIVAWFDAGLLFALMFRLLVLAFVLVVCVYLVVVVCLLDAPRLLWSICLLCLLLLACWFGLVLVAYLWL